MALRDKPVSSDLLTELDALASNADARVAPSGLERDVERLIYDAACLAESLRGRRSKRVSVSEDLEKRARRALIRLAALAAGGEVDEEIVRWGTQILINDALEPWARGLVLAFDYYNDGEETGWPIGANADRNGVDSLIERAEELGGATHPRMPRLFVESGADGAVPRIVASTAATYQRAIVALRKMKLAALGARAGGRARKISAYTAARRFAQAFDLDLPERERDLSRSKKTNRGPRRA